MDAERIRLQEARTKQEAWKKWGPYLSERQWGTVREDYSEGGDAWDYFTPRPGPLARLPLGRGRPGRHLRRPAAALLRAGAVERQGSDPQGAPVRPDQQREQPRRGRQGVLLLPRQHADALVHEVPLQVSAGGLPVRDLVDDQPQPQPQRIRVRAARHRRLRRGPLLRRVRRVRQGVARGHPDPDHGPQPRPGGGRAARPADALVPQLSGRGKATRTGPSSGRSPPVAAERRQGRRIPSWASATSTATATPPLLFTENETNTQRIFGVPNRRPYVKDGINDYVVHGQAEAVNPEQTGTKAAAHYRADRARRRVPGHSAAADRRRA